ncbi:MAG: type III-A CRISPR-associated protein Cas10/Csm1 [Pseudomonadota bacterium]|nr:type III-A CRISPR-associated protein Cas10/Csm1 [Pseudomonadota bacterium]MDP1906636.1 type III-A CRISPR-associated protein Cas10/Csm1 [Pseudomonadota bacterium]MDP2354055.1 type III-A CRISPR-associated protein Cas10/Csm1 [Pseudomonadota bacterium]
MNDKQRMNASSRVALAALLHDLGKFAERARIPEAQAKDADGNIRQAIEAQLACPEWKGRRTHIHAAYTAIGMDLLETHLPELVGEDMAPFAPWREKNADDSIINAAARHHRPDTFLQWIIASADRLASGFEREEFEAYNQAPDEDPQRNLNHYTTRQWTLLEGIRLNERVETREYRYPLKPLSPEAIFPVPAKVCETGDKAAAQARYLELWNQFQAGLKAIPGSHRANLPLWLDHFDSLWLAFTHAIPSATAGIAGNVRPDVALYDHSRTTAALAVALWRFHADQGHDTADIKEQLRAQWDRDRAGFEASRLAWESEKFLLIQGDFTGIQDFIFAGGESQRQVARLLRGRSFHVSLLSELAALKVLEALDLPPTSQVVNAAGKFLIVAPNTLETVGKLRAVQADLDAWFLAHTWGQSGINLAWLPARADDFRHGQGESPFRGLIRRLFEQLEAAKLTRFGLCDEKPPEAIYRGFLGSFKREQGECRIDGRSPGTVALEKDIWVSELAADQIDTGKWLASEDRLFISRSSIVPLSENQTLKQLRLPIFGFHVLFTRDEERTGKFGAEARSGNLARAWDFSLPASADAPLWNGYARRAINAFVPKFSETNAWESDRYQGLEDLDDFEPHPQAPKTLNHLARDDRRLDENGHWVGAEALMTLKGDIDNLGLIFQQGQERPTFARMAALSRQVNAFFTVWLPWVCRKEFPNTYTVFAGGDDFFLIGPWHSTIKLAQRMRDEFARYVAHNPDIHFSAGMSMTKPGLPIRHLGQLAEKSLDDAKKVSGKNAVTSFGFAVPWPQFDQLMTREESLGRLSDELKLSTGYLYGLLNLTDMAAGQTRPENALWHSRFAYRTRRMLEAKVRNEGDRDATERKRRQLQQELAVEIANSGIEKHGAAYKIALFTHLYQQRD